MWRLRFQLSSMVEVFIVFNHRLYLDNSGKLMDQGTNMPQAYGDMIKNMRELAAWRIKHGDVIQ